MSTYNIPKQNNRDRDYPTQNNRDRDYPTQNNRDRDYSTQNNRDYFKELIDIQKEIKKIYKQLSKEETFPDILNSIKTDFINNNISIDEENSSHKYKVFNEFLTFENIQIQKYTKSKGRYIYHNDFTCDWNTKKFRVITFLWYLNTIENGGETEFWTTHKVKPEAGKLLLFPATWTYPHRGMIPVSDNKYIMTGWIYCGDT